MPPEIDLARRSHALLMRAMEQEPGHRRDFVRSQCPDDPALMKRVLALLDAADRTSHFLDRPALESARGEPRPIPDAVGTYLIVGVLGVGGMATVYEAIQEHPKRRVALKVLNHSMADADAYLRFRFETETLARLHHPGIAQVYEAGAAQLGQPSPAPFFAMELVPDAVTITQYAERHDLPLRDRLGMLASVCDAVHYGHQHGVIHRDLKPANVLVDGEGRAKVIDFGVARTTEAGAESITANSDARRIVGTLNYMSPEQCGVAADIDIRADIYSLGVMLYELACGRLPHDLSASPIPAAMHSIIHDPPQRPVFIGERHDPDLEAIILKCLDKRPERRYESAAALATDLRRWLEHLPIEARPPGLVDQFRLFARRNPALVAAVLTVILSIALLAAISTGFAIRLGTEVNARRDAQEQILRERDEARWQAYTAQIAGALSAMKTGEFEQLRARLAASETHERHWEWGFLSRLADRSESSIVAHDDMIMDLAADKAWARLATACRDGSIKLWNAEDQALIATHTGEPGVQAQTVAFTRSGDRVITGDARGTVRLLDGGDLGEIEVIAKLSAGVRRVVALNDGRIAAAAGNGEAKIWTLDPRSETEFPDDQPGGIRGIDLSPDGSLVATYNDEGHVWVRRSDDFSVIRRLEFPGTVRQVRFTKDATRMAAAGANSRMLLWSLSDGSLIHEFEATQGVNTIRSLAISNDGSLIVAGLIHRGIVVCSTEDGRVIGDFGGHTDGVAGLAFSPDDEVLVSVSWDRTLRTWRTAEAAAPSGTTTLRGHSDHVMGVAFSPDGTALASTSRDGSVRVWDPDLGEVIACVAPGGGQSRALAFSPDGRWIASAWNDRVVRIMDATTGVVVTRLEGLGSSIASVAFDSAGRRVAAGGENGNIAVWVIDSENAPTVFRGHTARVNSLRFSPDGVSVASASRDGSVRVWVADTGEQTHQLTGHASDVFAVLFHPDGSRLYSGSRDQTIRVWDVGSGGHVATLAGHGQYVTCMAMSSDATRLVAGSWFGEVLLFDVATHDLIASFRAHESAIRGVDFSPDGRWIASASYDGTVRLFDSATREAADAARAQSRAEFEGAKGRLRTILSEIAADPEAVQVRVGEAGIDPMLDSWARKAILSILAPPEKSR